MVKWSNKITDSFSAYLINYSSIYMTHFLPTFLYCRHDYPIVFHKMATPNDKSLYFYLRI